MLEHSSPGEPNNEEDMPDFDKMMQEGYFVDAGEEAENVEYMTIEALNAITNLSPNLAVEINANDEDFTAPKQNPDPKLELKGIHPFFQEYWMQLVGKTEANKEMVLSALLTALSSACGNRVKFFTQDLCPNLYCLMVGPSSISKKSTAMMLGIKPLKVISDEIHDSQWHLRVEYEAEKKDYKERLKEYNKMTKAEQNKVPKPVMPEKPDIPFLSPLYPDETTPETLIDILQQKPDGLFSYHEFGKLLASFESKYMAGFKEKLTEFYDGTSKYYTRVTKEGQVTVKNARLAIIGCSTTQWLNRHLGSEDAFSGFLARFMIVSHRSKPDQLIAWPVSFQPTKEQVQVFRALLSIQDVTLEVDIEAKVYYEDWYTNFVPDIIYPAETMQQPFLTRKCTMIHKIAMINHLLTCLLEKKPINSRISKLSYEQAIPWIDFGKQCLEDALQDIIFSGNALYDKLLETIEKRGKMYEAGGHKLIKITRKKLHKLMGCSKKEYEEALETLVSQGLLNIDTSGSTTYVIRKVTYTSN